jgi:hypothetical protein
MNATAGTWRHRGAPMSRASALRHFSRPTVSSALRIDFAPAIAVSEKGPLAVLRPTMAGSVSAGSGHLTVPGRRPEPFTKAASGTADTATGGAGRVLTSRHLRTWLGVILPATAIRRVRASARRSIAAPAQLGPDPALNHQNSLINVAAASYGWRHADLDDDMSPKVHIGECLAPDDQMFWGI